MSRDEIINELIASGFVEKYVSQLIAKSEIDIALNEDIRQEIWLQILEVKEEKLMMNYNKGGMKKVKQYIAGLIFRNIKSSTSPIYTKLKRHYLTHIATNNFSKLMGEWEEKEK